MILTVRLRGVDGHRVVPRHGTHLLIRGWRGRLVFICKDHISAESGISPVGGFVHKCTCNNYLINIPYTGFSYKYNMDHKFDEYFYLLLCRLVSNLIY